MARLRVMSLLGVGLAGGAVAATTGGNPVDQAQGPAITVYKTATCGCCGKWVDHMKKAGFAVRTVDTDDLTEIKQASGVPMRLRTCHTALIEGYVIEGHVPADLVERLLKEKPAGAGLAVAGMPMGSPGMEGVKKDAYEVLLFGKDGKTTVYAKR